MHTKTLAKALLTSLAVTQFLMPVRGFATGTCAMDALDTVAGLGTQISVSGCGAQTDLSVTVTLPNARTRTLAIRTDSNGNGTAPLASQDTQIAGTYDVQAGNMRTVFTVMADRIDARRSTLDASVTHIAADGNDEAQVIASLFDRFGNPVSGRPVALVSSRSADRITADSQETDDEGTMSWRVRSDKAGTMTLSAYDILAAAHLDMTLDITVGDGSAAAYNPTKFTADLTGSAQGGDGFGTIDHFTIELYKDAAVKPREAFSFYINAMDADGNIVKDYTSAVTLSSSDADADYPKTVTFQPQHQGKRLVPLGFTFNTPGQQTITVRDQQKPDISGTLTVDVTGKTAGATGSIQIMDPKNDSKISTPSILLQGKGPSLINVTVKGGSQDVVGETDAEGVFRITVALKPDRIDHELTVVSESGQYESTPLHLILDNTPPSIGAVTFDPEIGKAGDKVTMTVETETALPSVTAIIEGNTITLAETSVKGKYSGQFTAPQESKTYDVTIHAKDDANNEAPTVIAKWTVKRKDLPVVQGVTAESRPQAVSLTWDAITEVPVTEYQIYVAEEPDNWLYTLKTGKPTTSAVINGLQSGKTYIFALTALNSDGEESGEKSQPVSAGPLGLNLKVTPSNQSLFLEWSALSGIPLAQYTLEYGTEPGVYSEKRVINGSLQAYTVHDLLNDITYELRLTPIAVTGKEMPELAEVVHGTPNGQGFHAGAGDPVPTNVGFPTDQGNQGPPQTGPRTTEAGLPGSMMWVILIGAVLLGIIVRQHWAQRKLARQFLSMMDSRYNS